MSLTSNIHELMLGGGSTSYNISNSLRIRSSANAGLYRTPASTTNSRTWTWSGWIKRGKLASFQTIWDAFYGNNSRYTLLYFNSNDSLGFQSGVYSTGASTSNSFVMNTTPFFRDPSSWYHVVIAFDTTQAISTNRIKMYVNGSQITAFTQYSSYNIYPNQNDTSFVNTNTQPMYIGYDAGQGGTSDFYLAEVNFIDGQQLDVSNFGSVNTTTGIWAPKRYSGSYGTNGYYLPFSDTSGTTSGSNTGIGKDFSGNGNYFTSSNISLTAGVTYDAMLDSPTPKSSTVGNYAVLNPVFKHAGWSPASAVIQQGNLFNYRALHSVAVATIPIKVNTYWEVTVSESNQAVGIISLNDSYSGTYSYSAPTAKGVYCWGVQGYVNGSDVVTSGGPIASFYGTATFMFAVDPTNGYMWVGKDGVWNGNPTAGTGAFWTNLSSSIEYTPWIHTASASQANDAYANFGQRPFTYTPPTGFKALQTYNLPTPAIKKGNQHFDVVLQTGNTTGRTVTGLQFKPDLVIVKGREGTTNRRWGVIDSVRGVNKTLSTQLSDAEVTSQSDLLTAFNSDGFTIGADAGLYGWNGYAESWAHFCWKGGGTAVTNTQGSITSQVSANPSSGFSIVTLTGPSSGAFTAGHGLGVAPSMIIAKVRNITGGWPIYHSALGATGAVQLESTGAFNVTSGYWNNTAPTSTVFTSSIGWGSTPQVFYCFAAVPGFSSFGAYTGNGSTDGPFVYLGFRPKFLLLKRSDGGSDWYIHDSVRDTYNYTIKVLYPNVNYAENSSELESTYGIDFLSNGFKIRASHISRNTSGGTYVYAAFAENPFQYSLAR